MEISEMFKNILGDGGLKHNHIIGLKRFKAKVMWFPKM
jgi:hypothetical protein